MASATTPQRICRWALFAFLVLYLIALALFVIGNYGLFGQEPTPLAGVFLIPLGAPWVFWLNHASLSDGARFWLGLLAPLINLGVIALLCRILRPPGR